MTTEVDKSGQKQEQTEGRRAALKKIAAFSAYTAPAMLTLMVSTKATAASRDDIQQPDEEPE